MEQSKRGSLSVARSILNHKIIGKKLESYLKVNIPPSGLCCSAFVVGASAACPLDGLSSGNKIILY